jgi:uncharacterized membrane protein (UPF0127 family)
VAERSTHNPRRWFPRSLGCLVIGALLLGSCSDPFDPQGDGLPRGTVEIQRGGESLARFDVELAVTSDDQNKGLMGRKSLPKEQGMAFLFAGPVRLPFHMQNTLIPLDIAFWNEDNEIVEILTMMPCTEEPCQGYAPATDYVGALEVNAGVLEDEDIRAGDTVVLTEG